jgi:chromosome condensin MukBEF complex kleisin-like MukF subunit
MKLTTITSTSILSLIPVSVFLTLTPLLLMTPATAQTSGHVQSECVRQTMYDAFGNIRPGMTAEAAAWACRGTTYNNAASDCVRQTLYDRFGNIRSGMTAEAAALACEEYRGGLFDVIVIPR